MQLSNHREAAREIASDLGTVEDVLRWVTGDGLLQLASRAQGSLRTLSKHRVCGNPHAIIRKYGLMCRRQCFHSNAKEIGFIKVSCLQEIEIFW
ncbi:hypothetical protein C5167_045635 [Papaver somniferum]|uniref:Uncharacterized protein n=1 Tax=Papaver somniferum TaxID=3469 RepID=A0A4Y7LDZ2_PAPSO|nr:hypothetical protein C5167_045635 [Papaver somniferum]